MVHVLCSPILGTNTGKENITLACEYVVFIVVVEVSGLNGSAHTVLHQVKLQYNLL